MHRLERNPLRSVEEKRQALAPKGGGGPSARLSFIGSPRLIISLFLSIKFNPKLHAIDLNKPPLFIDLQLHIMVRNYF
jgi:hypothetical protein